MQWMNILIWIFQIVFFLYCVESTGIISGTAMFLLLNLLFIFIEYKINKDFRDWYDSTVKAGISYVEGRIYDDAKLYKK